MCTSRLRWRHCSLHHSVKSGWPAGMKPNPDGAWSPYVNCKGVSTRRRAGRVVTDNGMQLLLLLRNGFEDDLVRLLLPGRRARLVKDASAARTGLRACVWACVVYSRHCAYRQQPWMAPSGCDRGCDRGWRLPAERAEQSGLVQRAVRLRVQGRSSRKPSVRLQAPFAMLQ
jgi:hypothetical protein